MIRFQRFACPVVALLAAPLTLAVGVVHAGDGIRPASCPCQEGSIHGAYAAPDWVPHPAIAYPPVAAHPPPVQAAPVAATPPPGTLGHTYQRRSWLIPVEKHPRVAMLDVTVAGASEVRVYTTYQYRLEDELEGFQDPDDPDVWHFESEPLIPGVPHIYRVEAVRAGVDPSLADVRYVRLIRGRRVTLEY